MQTKKCSGAKKIFYLFFVLLLLVLAAAVFLQLRTQRELQVLKANYAATQTMLQQQQTMLIDLQTDLASAQKLIKSNPLDWVLPEVNYLVRQANVALELKGDVQQAVYLVTAADKRLAQLHDPKLFAVRKAFASDLSSLAAVPQVDTVGIVLRLNNIATAIANIPMIPNHLLASNNGKLQKTVQGLTLWQRFWRVSGDKLKNIVIIRHHDMPMPPLLSRAHKLFVLQNIQLLLEQAKWAVLHKNPKVYASSLKRSEQLLTFVFMHNFGAIKPALNQLQQLQAINLSPTLPTLNASERALNNIMHTKAVRKTA